MVTRTLGRTGLRVSALALGTVELGLDYGISGSGDHRRPDEADAIALVHRALDLGLNFIDTARGYGESEAVLGRALRGKRDKVVLASKVGAPADAIGATLREEVARSIETSLRLLQTDCVDVMSIHNASLDVLERDDVFAALVEAREAGKLRFIGATTYGADAALAVIAHGGYDCVQVAYNVLDRALDEDGVLARARNRGVGVVVRSVLLKGALTHRAEHLPPALDELKRASARVAEIARDAGMSLPELAYRYVLANENISSALAGTSRIAELEQLAAYASAPPLPDSILDKLREIRLSAEWLTNPAKWPAI